MLLSSLRRGRVKRRIGLIAAFAFLWSFVIATPAQLMAQSALHPPKRLGMRTLSEKEMERMVGRTSGHAISVSAASGSGFAWVGGGGDFNASNGNKLTSLPIVGWTQRGGLPVALSLNHNSASNHNSELGYKFTHSYDIYLTGVGFSSDLAIHWGDDQSYTFTQNINGSYSPPAGIHDELVKNINNTYTLTRPDQTAYHFTTGLYCDTISDENGNTVTIGYNANNFVTSITDATSRAITLSYTGTNITTITDPLSRTWTLSYSGSGELATVTYPALGMTSYTANLTYNGAHNITDLQDRRGNHWTFGYSSNALTSETDPAGNVVGYSYGSGTTTITDPNGHTTVEHFTSGKLTSVVDAASETESYTWDADNNKTQTVDKRGYHWDATFDAAGNVLTSVNPYSDTTTNTYNSHNKLLTSTDPLGHVSATIVYDANDNPTSVTDALSHVVSTTYTAYGEPDTVTDALSHATSMTYDTDGNCTLIVDANSNQVAATFDGLGHKLTATDQLSHTTTWTLDNWCRATSVATPAGTTSMAYDAESHVTSVTDDNAHTTSQTFDTCGRPLVSTKANGDTFTHSYDATGKLGLLSSTTDGNSHVITYSYTARNQKSSVAYPDSTGESWTYDANGELASHTDGRAYTTNYTMDHAGRLTLIDYPHDTDVSITYDAAGRKTGMTDGSGTTGWTIDNANRCTQIAQPNGTVTYGYDNANRRTSMAHSGTGTWSYSFDAGNRLTSTTNPNSETTSFTLDNAGRITRQDFGNTTYALNSYDTANRITEIQTKNSGGTQLSDLQYAYDGVNITSRTDTDGTVTSFGYDDSNQLTSEVRDNSHSTGYSIAYTYDGNQNRLTKVLSSVTENYTYDNHDKLTAAGSKSYGYDSNGNCISVTVGMAVTSLTWDDSDRCTGITYPSTATNFFVYNGEDLRVSKTDSAGTSAVITDGTSPASAVLKDARAVYTPGISERASGTSKFYHGDALGSTRGITNGSQIVTDAVLYDAFGMTVSRTGSTPTPFGFVGAGQYQTDQDSGLMLLGHRMYDPSAGRFISSDPAKAGSNWYAYCGNNPVRRADSAGLDGVDNATNMFAGWGAALTQIPATSMLNSVGQAVGQNWNLPTSWTGLANAVTGSSAQIDQSSGWYIGGSIAGNINGSLLTAGLINCFVAGTPVQMAGGKCKPIEKVKKGDRVVSRDPITGKTESKRVVRTFVHKDAKTLLLRFEGGEQITTTPGHPFFVRGKGFVLAGRLAVGNAIVTRAGPATKVVDIERHSPKATVYNFEVADYHTYFVAKTSGGLWVHNVSMWFYAELVMPDNMTFTGQNAKPIINSVFQTFLQGSRPTCAEVNVVNQAFNYGYQAIPSPSLATRQACNFHIMLLFRA